VSHHPTPGPGSKLASSLLALALLGGCGPGAPAPSSPHQSPETATILGALTDFQTGDPIAQALICAGTDEGAPCTTSDQGGFYRLDGVSEDRAVRLVLSADGFVTVEALIYAGKGMAWTTRLVSTGLFDAFVGVTGSTPDPDLGTFVTVAYDGSTLSAVATQGVPQSDASLSLDPALGDGPFYFAGGLPSPNASGTDALGIGYAVNLPPGTYTVRFDHPTGTCRPGHGLVSHDGSYTFDVHPGVITHLGSICDVAAPGLGALAGVVFDRKTGAGIGGARVCLDAHHTEVCATSDDQGDYRLEGIEAQAIAHVRVEAEGYTPSRTAVTTGATGAQWDAGLVATTVLSELIVSAGLGGVDLIEGGSVLVFASDVYGAPVAGVTLATAPTSGGTLKYLDSDLVALDTAQTGPAGLVALLGLDPGAQLIGFSHATGGCVVAAGVEDDASIHVEGGWLSLLDVTCIVPKTTHATLTGVITDFTTGDPIPGVQICVSSIVGGPCAITGPDGRYVLEDAPRKTDSIVTVDAQGYALLHAPINFGDGAEWDVRMVSEPIYMDMAGAVDIDVDHGSSRGCFLMVVHDAATAAETVYHGVPLAGASFTLSPDAGQGPLYLAGGKASIDAPATDAAGIGAMINVPVGTYKVSFQHPWGDCVPTGGLVPDEDGTVSFEVHPNGLTYMGASCTIAEPEDATVIGTITDFLTGAPVSDASVCVDGPAVGPCTLSDADGSYTLPGAPVDAVIDLQIAGDDLIRIHTPLDTGYGLSWNSRVLTKAARDALLGAWNIPVLPASQVGDYVMVAYDAETVTDTTYQGVPVSGVTLHLDPEGPQGSVYFDGGVPSPTATETDGLGIAAGLNLSPGTYRATFTHKWATCVAGHGLQIDADGGVEFTIVAGEVTTISALCTLDPPDTLSGELAGSDDCGDFLSALEAAGLDTLLSDGSVQTVLAPTNDALAQFMAETPGLTDEALTGILRHHLLADLIEASSIDGAQTLWPLDQRPIEAHIAPLQFGDALATESDGWTLNGVIHVLDRVVIPPPAPPSDLQVVSAEAAAAATIGPSQPTVASLTSGADSGAPMVTVYTPPGYYADRPEGYPILYLLHDVAEGVPALLNAGDAGLSWSFRETLDGLVDSGALPPMIVVLPNGLNEVWGSYFVDSQDEAFGHHGAYLEALITWVEGEWNVAGEPGGPGSRAVAGLGMGGFGALHLAAKSPIFDAVIAHSAPLDLADLANPDAVVAAHYEAVHGISASGTLASQVLAEWSVAVADDPSLNPDQDGALRAGLLTLLGPNYPAITRAVSLASALSPVTANISFFDMAEVTGGGGPLVIDLDDNPANNNALPVRLLDDAGTADSLDDTWLGIELPFLADGTPDSAIWAAWVNQSPYLALADAAPALAAAGTLLYMDCGTLDERGYHDQMGTLIATLQAAGLGDQLTTEIFQGGHSDVFHTQRLLKALLWLGSVLP